MAVPFLGKNASVRQKTVVNLIGRGSELFAIGNKCPSCKNIIRGSQIVAPEHYAGVWRCRIRDCGCEFVATDPGLEHWDGYAGVNGIPQFDASSSNKDWFGFDIGESAQAIKADHWPEYTPIQVKITKDQLLNDHTPGSKKKCTGSFEEWWKCNSPDEMLACIQEYSPSHLSKSRRNLIEAALLRILQEWHDIKSWPEEMLRKFEKEGNAHIIDLMVKEPGGMEAICDVVREMYWYPGLCEPTMRQYFKEMRCYPKVLSCASYIKHHRSMAAYGQLSAICQKIPNLPSFITDHIDGTERCNKCNGKGSVPFVAANMDGTSPSVLKTVDCEKCQGTGVHPTRHFRGCWVIDGILNTV